MQEDIDALFATIRLNLEEIAESNKNSYVNYEAALNVAHKMLRVRLNTAIDMLDCYYKISQLQYQLDTPITHL